MLLLVLLSIFSGFGGPPPKTTAASLKAVRVTYLADETQALKLDCPAKATTCFTVPFVQAIMMQESGGNTAAHSSAGALGLMQVTRGKVSASQDPIAPLTNIEAGVTYLNACARWFGGDLELTAACYNAGPGTGTTHVRDLGVRGPEKLAGATQWPAVAAYIKGHSPLHGYLQTVRYVSGVMGFFAEFQKPDPLASPGRP